MPDLRLSCGCYVPEDSQPLRCSEHGTTRYRLTEEQRDVLRFLRWASEQPPSIPALGKVIRVDGVDTSSERVDSWPPSWLGWEDGYGHGV